MKITTDTPNLMVIDYIPWRAIWIQIVFLAFWGTPGVALIWFDAFGMGLFFIAVGACLPLMFGLWIYTRAQIVCNRADNTFELRHKSFGGYTRLPADLHHVEKFSTPAKTSDHRGHLSVHLSGGMNAGTHQFNPVRARWSRLNHVTTRANAWLDEGRT